MDIILVWFRNDLRIHDNEILYQATQQYRQENVQIVPVYCFDERHFEKIFLGFPKTSSFRTQFLIETVTDLKNSLQKIGSDLVIRIGKPETEMLELAKILQAKAVYSSQEVTAEETFVENKLITALHNLNCESRFLGQSTLLHKDDLPFAIHQIPDIFTEFRKACEKKLHIRQTFPTPQKLNTITNIANLFIGKIPTVADLGLSPLAIDKRSVLQFKGGETAALTQLKQYFWEKDLLKTYKATRNGLIGSDYSSKFSAWLAVGAISPRKIYEEIIVYETQRTKNESTYWLFFELLWRDYFRFIAQKYGNRLFMPDGLKGDYQKLRLTDNKAVFEKWKNGKTTQPFVNANMIELQKTGFMSNRGRQNVASYLVKDLKVNWLWGAMYFESLLIDYDVCSNWGNWNYVAGVGNDPRENRYFNIEKQAKTYDPQGEYVKLWLS
jgi:deoxyribodipyrimidine photo-lyase